MSEHKRGRGRRPVGGRLSSAGFTLVELLVVVTIIALLIAILLPSLRKAREQAKLGACMANLTGIAKAGTTYAAEDRNENMIPVGDINAMGYAAGPVEYGGKAGIGDPTPEGEPVMSFYGTRNYRGPAHRPLNASIFKTTFTDYNPTNGAAPNPGTNPPNSNWLGDTKLNLGIYRCPSDTGYAGGGFIYTGGRHLRDERHFKDEGLTAYDHFGTSYAANCFFIIGGVEGNRVRSQSMYMAPLSRVPTPSETIAYQEMPSLFAWLWGTWHGSDCEDIQPPRDSLVLYSFNTIPGWHRRNFGFTVAFGDGHAEMVEIKGCQRPAPNLGLQNYPAWVCGSSMDAYTCDRCVTIRGPGWRIDTLPAPSTITPWFWDDVN